MENGKKLLKSFFAIAMLVLLFIASHAQDIFHAVKANDLAKVKALVEKDASLMNLKDEAGNAPLHHAAIVGSVEMAEFLLLKGTDINAPNTRLNTPLHEALNAQKTEMAKFLIEKGADIHKENLEKQTPLNRAANRSLIEIGKILIAKGAVIDTRDRYQRTPFLCVARHTGNVEFGKLLMAKGANINLKDGDYQTALNLAASKGYNDFINFLLDSRAEYDTSRNGAQYLLNDAARYGSSRLFKYVLEKESDLLSDEQFMRNVIRNAVAGGSIEIVKLLLSKNIPLNNNANQFGWTPAHFAAANGHASMIRFLKENNLINFGQRTLSGKSIYNIAEENKKEEVVKTIQELHGDTSSKQFPRLTGFYLGQEPPVHEPKLFAPDIVSSVNGDDNHSSLTIGPDDKEIYWNMRNKIWMTKLENGRWIEPEIAPFCKNDSYMYDNPFITPDGKKMFFTSTRSGSVSSEKENIWYVEKTSSGWSEPKPASPEINAMTLHWSISVSRDGTLYWGGRGQDSYGRNDIYYSKLVNGVYSKPVNMGLEINSSDEENCPYIAPDESYIIFTRFTSTGENYYISYKNKSNTWRPPIKIHEELQGVSPKISPDGKYFFFLGDGIYWVPAKFIEALRPKE